ncbi:MAG: TraR/DksA C4-type zinc finger protein [Actinobacteria bacterium]|nr:TraR/DksA C4-type zinc finger protein [Actinomycetota bacterium]
MSANRPLARRSLDALTRQLERRRDTALAAAGSFLAEAVANQATADRSDQLDLDTVTGTTSEESYALAAHAEEAAREAEEALARIADGTYGVCAGCGADIPYPRLRALPTATHCVRCAEGARLPRTSSWRRAS